jgi:proline dehydrogenase
VRRLLLWMAGNNWLRRNVPRLPFARRAVRRFMPGESADAALSAAEAFRQKGIPVIFTRLGENLTRIREADETTDAYVALMDDARKRGLDAEMSVKLTQLGLDFDADRALAHMQRLAAHAADERAAAGEQLVAASQEPAQVTEGDGGPRTLWIDMEGSAYTDPTLDLYERLKADHANVGICLQAYLKRTYNDVERLLPVNPRIRLVKGAYAEPEDIAYQSRREVDANYLALCVSMLRERKAGRSMFIGLGTHDVRLIAQVAEHAASIGLDKTAFDVEMLYGIRSKQRDRLKKEGYNVRVLIAYGDYWYPWYMRRLAERPANVIFAMRQLLP